MVHAEDANCFMVVEIKQSFFTNFRYSRIAWRDKKLSQTRPPEPISKIFISRLFGCYLASSYASARWWLRDY